MKVPRVFLVIGLFLSPVYLWRSGLPQIADMFFLLFLISSTAIAMSCGIRVQISTYVRLLWMLTVWVAVHTLVMSMLYSDPRFLLHSLFWSYNFLLALFLHTQIINGHLSLNFIRAAIGSSISLCLFGVVMNYGSIMRSTGFFNNPNQLAYFSLLVLCITLYIDRLRIKIDPFSLFVYSAGVLCILVSASLTAWAALAVLVIGLAFANLHSLKGVIYITFGALVFGGSVVAFDNAYNGELISNIMHRATMLDGKLDGFEEQRRIDIIFDFPSQLLLGAGEARHFERFGNGLEIHNAFINTAFNYGVFGISLLTLIFISAALRQGFASFFPVLAVGTYNLTHMGLRTTMLWIFLSILFADVEIRRRGRFKL